MSDYTPTTSEVRTYYGLGRYEFQPDSCEHPSELHPEFDRWLAQVKADALRDAADALETVTTHWSNGGEDTRAAWLRRRADQEEERQ